MRILILGGTSEATALAQALRAHRDIKAIVSLAGRTQNPVIPWGRHRIGGFGGIAGLADYLGAEKIDAMVDATHPFAAQMSEHAVAAAAQTGIALARFTRLAWQAQPGDHWIEVETTAAAVAALGEAQRRCFLTIGRLGVLEFAAAPQHYYLVRTIDEVAEIERLASHKLMRARPPFTLEDEIALMRDERIDVLVTKNSGGKASAAKLGAARALRLPVVMVRPPPASSARQLYSLSDCLKWIFAHRPAP